jgi:high-affinity iron transporter
LTALAAYLVKVKQGDKRWLLYAGAGGAVVASMVLAVLARFVTPVEGHMREALEGVTMLIAAAVLFSASYWLISKSEARRWQEFVRTKLEGALSSRRRAGLFVLAFLVVFREGFETVLFYEALLARAQAGVGGSVVWSGFACGAVLLAIIGTALFRYGIRIPVRPFFAVTGVLLYVLAFKFAGGGVRELQEAGWVSVTAIAMPDLPWLRDWLAIYPSSSRCCCRDSCCSRSSAAPPTPSRRARVRKSRPKRRVREPGASGARDGARGRRRSARWSSR